MIELTIKFIEKEKDGKKGVSIESHCKSGVATVLELKAYEYLRQMMAERSGEEYKPLDKEITIMGKN